MASPFLGWRRWQSFVAQLFSARRKQPHQRKPTKLVPNLELLEGRLVPSTTTVNVSTYTDAALRSAVSTAIAESANNIAVNIDFVNGPGTILLTGGALDLAEGSGTGLITVNATNQNITIDAQANQANSGAFTIESGSQVAIDTLAVVGGSASEGGAVDNLGTLTLNSCIFSNNSVTGDGDGVSGNGGAIFNGLGGTLTLNDSTLAGNSATLPASDSTSIDGGGSIYNLGTLTLNNSLLSDNSVIGGDGGAICNDGTLTVNSSTLTGNSAVFASGTEEHGFAGGIFNESTLTVSGSTFSGNSANDDAGAIYLYSGTTAVSDSTLSNNFSTTSDGGGIAVFQGAMTVSNSTLSGNSAAQGQGGGIAVIQGTLAVSDSTLSGNFAGSGGGISNDSGDSLSLKNTIVAGNISVLGPDINSTVTGSNNIVGDGSGMSGISNGLNGNQVGVNPDLEPLGNYGGPTETMALMPGSPAIGAGAAIAGTTTDQRGAVRAAVPDIGAYQFNVPAPTVLSLNSNDGSTAGGTSVVISGTNFSGATTVLFGSTPASFTVNSATQITAVAPAENSGTVNVTVDAAGGASATSSGDQFTYQGAPLASAPVTIAVDNYTDNSSDAAVVGTLRYAIATANADSLNDTPVNIDFVNGAGTILLTGGVLDLAAGSGTGLITINATNQNMTIDNLSNSGTFMIAGSQVAIDNLTMVGGSASDGGGILNGGTLTVNNSALLSNSATPAAEFPFALGGGIYNVGTLTLNSSLLSGNTVTGDGGGIFNSGVLTVNKSTLAGNSATVPSGADGTDFGGGGIFNAGTLTVNSSLLSANSGGDGGGILNTGTLTLNESTLAGNSATMIGTNSDFEEEGGGGIYDVGTLTVNSSTFSGNSAAGYGGALLSYGGPSNGSTVTMSNSTLSGNSAYEGAGMQNFGRITVLDSTIADNSSYLSGGIGSGEGATTIIENTIVAANGLSGQPEADIGGSVLGNNNIIGNGSGMTGISNGSDGNKVGVNPDLEPLGNYGGPTETMALMADSPAIGAGAAVAGITTDQRGATRASPPDIGAYQYNVPAPTVVSLSTDVGPEAGGTSVVITGTNFSGATAVMFGFTPATSFTVDSPTQITAVAPAAIVEPVYVRVETLGGTSATSSSDIFMYYGPPSVVAVGDSASTLSLADVGSDTFQLNLYFNETMNPAIAPTITFSPNVSTILTPAQSYWDSTDSTYTVNYNVANLGANVPSVNVSISGAQDTYGDTQIPFSAGDLVAIEIVGSTTTVADAGGTYDGSPFPATSVVTGTGGLNTVASSLDYFDTSTNADLGSNAPVNAGSYTVTATYNGDANHAGSSNTVAFTINQASSTTTVFAIGGTYDGFPSPVESLVTGAGGLNTSPSSLDYFDTDTNTDLGSSAPVNAGNYTVTATYNGDINHLGSSDMTAFTIRQDSSTTTVADAGGTYNGSPFPATSSSMTGTFVSTPVANSLDYFDTTTNTDLGSTAPVNAGNYTVTATYSGDANHAGSSDTVAFTINQASSTTTVFAIGGTYDGFPSPVESLVTGAGGLNTSPSNLDYFDTDTNTDLGSSAPVNAGNYTVTATYNGDANHTGSSDTTAFTIRQDSSTTTVADAGADAGGIYNGSPFPASSAVTGAGGLNTTASSLDYFDTDTDTDLGSTAPVNAGNYTVTATYNGDANHTGSSDTVAFTISQATPMITWANPASITYGTPLCGAQLDATASVPGTFTYTSAVGSVLGAGTQTLSVTFTPADTIDFTPSTASVQLVVAPAATETTVSSPVNPSVDGQVVAFTANVTSQAVPTGSVQFQVDGTNLGSPVPLNAAGTAVSPGIALAAGNHLVTVTYVNSDGNFTGSSGSLLGGEQVNALTAANLQTDLTATSTPTIQVTTDSDLQSVVSAVNALTAPTTPVTVTVNVGDVSLTDVVASPPANVTLVIVGNGSTTTIVGNSPALTVTKGTVLVTGMTLTTATNAPTILVSGGNLVLRDDTVEESSGFTDAAIAVSDGGTLDLGTAASPGNNLLEVIGTGEFVHNTTSNLVPALGDTFTVNGVSQPAALSFTSLASSSLTPGYSQAVTLTATVRADGSGTPLGGVDFFDTSTGIDLGSGTLDNGVATLTTTNLSAGTHVIQATYSGDDTFTLSLDSVTLTVTQAMPLVAVTDVGGTYNGSAFAATATVTGTNGASGSSLEGTGLTITYYSGTYSSASQLTGLTGSSTAPSTPGSYTVLASFAGSIDYKAASALANFSITGIGETLAGDVDVLNQTAGGALSLTGNAVLNVASTLEVASGSAGAVNLSGNSEVSAAQTMIVGSDQVAGNAHFSHTPTTHAASVANPLAVLAAPTGGTSDAAINLSGNNTLTIDPGSYPSIIVSGNAELILNPGTYIIGSGGITVSGNATLTSKSAGVLIYNDGAMSISGTASVNLTASSTGVYAGLAIFQAQNDANDVTVSGNANLNLNGSLLYDADVQSVVTISGNAQVEASFVVNELTISGNADVTAL